MEQKDNNTVLKLALDYSKSGILITDLDGKIKYANIECHNILGYGINSLIGMNIDDLHITQIQNEFKALCNSLKDRRELNSFVFERRLQSKPDKIFQYQVSPQLVRDTKNEIEYCIWHIQNLSKQASKKNELNTLLDYERYVAQFTSALMKNEVDGINKSLQFLLQASNSSRVYIFENFLDDENRLSTKQTYEACALGIEPEINNPLLQHVIYERDGFERWANELSNNNIINGIVAHFPKDEIEILEPQGIKSILIIPIWVNHKWHGFIGFDDTINEKEFSNYDIDLLRSASEIIGLNMENLAIKSLLIQNNLKLQEANSMKDRFISILAHDLRSPFTSIIGFSQLLLKNIDKNDTATIKEFAEFINNSAKHTYSLLENLLEWSRSQRNEIAFKPKPTNILQIVEETCSLLDNNLIEKSINLNLEIDNKLSAEIDREMIKTVIRNLLSNAIKFTSNFGSVTISAIEERSSLKIQISDDGIGMSSKVISSLFKFDKIVSNTGTAGEKGTGFGLLLCKHFIDQHKGTINLESKEGEGTQILITLPKFNRFQNEQ